MINNSLMKQDNKNKDTFTFRMLALNIFAGILYMHIDLKNDVQKK